MVFFIKIFLLFCIYSMLTISQNFLLGKAGVVYVGHIAFFAVGAYVTAIFSSIYDINIFISILVGISVSVTLAIFLGSLTVRLSGHYLLLASLGVCEIIRSILNNSEITGGAEGVLISNGISANNLYLIYFLILFLSFFQVLFFFLLENSPKGRVYKAARDDPIGTMVLGHSVNKLKIEAMIISSIWASLAGSLFALFSNYIDPTSFTILESLAIFIVILIGGVGSLKGSLIGAFILIIFPSLLRFIELPSTLIGSIQQILIGITLIIIITTKPEGIFGEYRLK